MMLENVALAGGSFMMVVTALSLLRAKAWWIRIWDFPRMQLAVVGAASLATAAYTSRPFEWWPRGVFLLALAAAVAYQAVLVWRYSPLAPLEVQNSRSLDSRHRLALVMSNVLQTNRDADRLLAVIRSVDSDVVLCVETDDWWRTRLDALLDTHPHTIQCPLDNTYGMLLYSRLPLHETSTDFLIQPDIPSMQAHVELRDGQLVWLNCVHPRPPAPGESDESLERDAELLLVGKRVCDAELPVVVWGDLNDVAWSRTTRLFQKASRLVEPRKGRGFYSTFHARIPGLRFPLDHIFHSDSFRLSTLRRLPYAGSDHFPVYAVLSHEPDAEPEQEAPDADAADEREVHETIAEGKEQAPAKQG
jgi:endonuclease/exonuclease/phosphatase (EEP) superfamily protein YafD